MRGSHTTRYAKHATQRSKSNNSYDRGTQEPHLPVTADTFDTQRRKEVQKRGTRIATQGPYACDCSFFVFQACCEHVDCWGVSRPAAGTRHERPTKASHMLADARSVTIFGHLLTPLTTSLRTATLLRSIGQLVRVFGTSLATKVCSACIWMIRNLTPSTM